MQRDSLAIQRGQGWLISFAVIILIAAIAAVAYTIIKAPKKISTTEPVQTVVQNELTDADLQDIISTLVSKHLGDKQGSREEDIQALSNTLSNLQSHPHHSAKSTLLLLKDNKLSEATNTLKALALETTTKRDAAKLWIDLGNINSLLSTEEALKSYQKAVALDPDNINAWNRIGHLERMLKNYDQAEIAYKNVTRLSDDLSHTQALSFANFGLLHQSQNKHTEAIESFHEALRINTQIDNSAGIASNNENLASLYRVIKKEELAEQHYQAAFALYEAESQTSKMIEIHSALGSLYQSKQDTERALAEYEKAMTLGQDNPNKHFNAGLYSKMGILAQENRELDKAESYFQQALTLYQATQEDKGVADQYSNLAILARSKKQFASSEDLHLKAITLYQKESLNQDVINQYINLGFLYTAWGKADTACKYWNKSLDGLSSPSQIKRKQRIEEIIQRDCQPSSTM